MSNRIIGKSENTIKMNNYLQKLGLNTKSHCLKAWYSYENWCFNILGKDIKAIIWCFNNSKYYNDYLKKNKKANNNLNKNNLNFLKDSEHTNNSNIVFSINNLFLNLVKENKDILINNESINVNNLLKTDDIIKHQIDLNNYDQRYSILYYVINNNIYEFDNYFFQVNLKYTIKDKNIEKYLKKSINSITEIDPKLENFDVFILSN